MRITLKNFNKPVIQTTWIATVLLTIPRFICGGLLAFSFGSDKFGMPWSPSGSELGLLEVAAWFPEDVASFGGLFSIAPVFFAWLGAASEAIGGLFLMVGYKTRTASLFIAMTMLVAIVFQQWDRGIWAILPALGFLWVALQGLAMGSGRLGLDFISPKIASFLLNRNQRTLTHSLSQKVKQASLILVLVSGTALAQVKGNGTITTVTIPIENLTAIEMNLYANVTIDTSMPSESMTITGDENLLAFIDTKVVSGTMELKQTQWIQPSKRIEISIDAPRLEKLQVGVHETVVLKNVGAKNLWLSAVLGKIEASGIVENLYVDVEAGVLDANKLTAQTAIIDISGDGKAIINTMQVLESELSDEARLELVNQPNKTIEEDRKAYSKQGLNTEYISVKIKNNSFNRNHFEVRGPRKDGSYFGYGFPMMPGAVKKERWTIGTKVYKKTKLGGRTLLVTLTPEDADTVVKLFE